MNLHDFKNGELDFGYVLICRHSNTRPIKDILVTDIKKLGGVKKVKKIKRRNDYRSPECFLNVKLTFVLSKLMGFNQWDPPYLRFYQVDKEPNFTFLKIKYHDVTMKSVYLDYSVFEKMINEYDRYEYLLRGFDKINDCRKTIENELSGIAGSSCNYAEEDYIRMLDISKGFYEGGIATAKDNLASFFK